MKLSRYRRYAHGLKRFRWLGLLVALALAGTLPAGVLPGVLPLFVSPPHPRYNAFDWETWHELDVLRRELAPRFEARKP